MAVLIHIQDLWNREARRCLRLPQSDLEDGSWYLAHRVGHQPRREVLRQLHRRHHPEVLATIVLQATLHPTRPMPYHHHELRYLEESTFLCRHRHLASPTTMPLTSTKKCLIPTPILTKRTMMMALRRISSTVVRTMQTASHFLLQQSLSLLRSR